jgi:predicted secreted protein
VGDVIDALTRQLGREPQFSLSLTEVPVQGAVWRRTSAEHVLVSRQQREHSEISTKLAEIVRELDGGDRAIGGL